MECPHGQDIYQWKGCTFGCGTMLGLLQLLTDDKKWESSPPTPSLFSVYWSDSVDSSCLQQMRSAFLSRALLAFLVHSSMGVIAPFYHSKPVEKRGNPPWLCLQWAMCMLTSHPFLQYPPDLTCDYERYENHLVAHKHQSDQHSQPVWLEYPPTSLHKQGRRRLIHIDWGHCWGCALQHGWLFMVCNHNTLHESLNKPLRTMKFVVQNWGIIFVDDCQHQGTCECDVDWNASFLEVLECCLDLRDYCWMLGQNSHLSRPSKCVSILNLQECLCWPFMRWFGGYPFPNSATMDACKKSWLFSLQDFHCIAWALLHSTHCFVDLFP